MTQAAREEIALLLTAGVGRKEIARRFHVHESTVSRYRQNNAIFGQPIAPRFAPLGRRQKVTVEAREGLINWLLKNGDDKKLSYLDKMVIFL